MLYEHSFSIAQQLTATLITKALPLKHGESGLFNRAMIMDCRCSAVVTMSPTNSDGGWRYAYSSIIVKK